MITFKNGGRLVEEVSELPRLPLEVGSLYRDYETSSNDPKVKSLNPWLRKHCSVIGVGVTWDDAPGAWFVSRRVLNEGGLQWLSDLTDRSGRVVNHNTKYDAHVEHEDLGLIPHPVQSCTIARTNILDADRTYKGGYGLDAVSRTLLDKNIGEWEERLQLYLPKKGKHANKDYGKVPIDILADYGCQDVITNRELDRYLDKNLPENTTWVQENETKLTSVLIEMERHGFTIEPTQVKTQLLRTTYRMIEIEEELNKRLGKPFTPTSHIDCYDLLINRYQFPEIMDDKSAGWTTGNASFGKHILKNYAKMPTHAEYSEIVMMILEYRSLSTHKGLFWEPWLYLEQDGQLHSDYQQNKRSGRTGCKQPNAQQLDKIAKSLVRARKGRKLLCYDYSQLEYRWMMHYLQNEAAIHAYNTNPATDYHEWVARVLCEGLVGRQSAKTINFCVGFGGGKKRVLSLLAIEPEVIAMAGGDPYNVQMLALRLYNGYHKNLPELKPHQKAAEQAARTNGHVTTLYGRRLHLPPEFAFKGFNRVVQSTAGDNAKEAMVLVSTLYNKKLRDLDAHLIAMVHDEMLFDVPDDEHAIREIHTEINRCLEAPGVRCRVPIIADCGKPSDDWRTAKG